MSFSIRSAHLVLAAAGSEGHRTPITPDRPRLQRKHWLYLLCFAGWRSASRAAFQLCLRRCPRRE
jgi:hypothetical protein